MVRVQRISRQQNLVNKQSRFREFVSGFPHAMARYIQRLRAIRATLECSDFFRSHEVIGSSLLFVRSQTGQCLVNRFCQNCAVAGKSLHRSFQYLEVGNHEDGYLIGINNLIDIFSELEIEINTTTDSSTTSCNSLTPSTGSSPTSLSPKRSVSETQPEAEHQKESHHQEEEEEQDAQGAAALSAEQITAKD
ncbi:Inositol-trisphosphate 3-kinase B [Eumeta japonica]|uniref:Kinase n=1 Tax=Eumeta variegata TaxID=151549 RepID=A0A4C1SKJ4_EUMVA|nr:Inositol-trisphosphate 3-kinase B [Eumeta japonica]